MNRCYNERGKTIQELLCQFFTKINECIDDVNTYTKLVKDLNDWIRNQDLENEVIKILGQWEREGKFTELITKGVFPQFQIDLDKRIKYFNNIQDMKADSKLQEGQFVVTKGSLSADDGGVLGYVKNGSELSLIKTRNKTVVYASEIGMTPADQSNKNQSILAKHIDKGYTIVVDGVYDINYNSTMQLNNNVNIIGLNNDSKLFLKGSANGFFKISPNSDVSLKNIKFESKPTCKIFDNDSSNIYVNSIYVYSCEFENIRLMYWRNVKDVDPSTIKIGLSTFKFLNNKINNVMQDFVIYGGLPVNNFEVGFNTIKNIDGSVFSCGIENGERFEDSLLKLRNFKIHDNILTNDDNIFSDSNDYLCLALVEGFSVVFERNHVEGLKSKKTQTSICDGYLSCQNVIHRNNTWINNIVLVNNALYNALMKAKGAGGKKLFENNIYIVDENYITKLGYTINDTNVELYNSTSKSDWIIRNNFIDVCSLRCSKSSTSVYRMLFENNIVKCKQWKDSYLFNISNGGELICEKNDIILKNPVRQICELIHIPGDFIYNKLEFNNNSIVIENPSHVFYDVKANESRIVGNSFKIIGDRFQRFAYKGNLGNSILDNRIECFESVVPFMGDVTNLKQMKCTFKAGRLTSDTGASISFKLPTKTTDYLMEIKVYSKTNGIQSATSRFRLINEGGTGYMALLKDGSESPKYQIGTDEGRNQDLKINGTIPYGFSFMNYSDGQCYIYLKVSSTINYPTVTELSITTV